ncbi:hypothetical protein FH972_003279 [Carpinus fangiana]|uniref:STAS domain-containing protein n=1 Tax=Carpinus fangiana TaxID=176857 RepID=A0A5N6QHG7_9ROSI|nr:hypothetical protein FH972_003279 [Carpinus fangiana]
MGTVVESEHLVSFAPPRSFATTLKSDLKETFFPEDPFRQFRNEKPAARVKKALQFFVPIFEWLPKYNLKLLRYDLLAGVTITSLAIPQGISYAKLANLPPIIGLYSSFVPPLIYALFGNSKHLAVGTVAACSLLLQATISDVVSPKDDPALYLHLVFTATFVTGIFQTALGFLRLGILVDFLSHSTITGFMGGTAIIICLQQLKGFFGLTHFTTKTDVVSVMRTIFKNRKEWKWESAVVGISFLCFLQSTRYVRKRRPKLFWVSAIAPMVTVLVGCLFAYFFHAEDHGIQIVGELKKGINPPSINLLNFDSKYLPTVIKAGVVTGLVALAVRPFSKTAVNFNAGCRTAMSNIVMAVCMGLTLLFLAPLFRYTPLVALSAIIMSAMFGLIDYEAAYHLFKVDKFDFVICMAAFFGVAFISMDVGLMLSVGLGILRALLYVARPATCKLGKVSSRNTFRDSEQYPGSTNVPGVLVLQLGSPIYFANSTYIRERILRWIREEQAIQDSEGHILEHVLLDLTGVTSIDITGIETLIEVRRSLQANEIKMAIINPRIKVMEKMMASKFIDIIGKEFVFLCIDDAIESCRFSLHKSKHTDDSLPDSIIA